MQGRKVRMDYYSRKQVDRMKTKHRNAPRVVLTFCASMFGRGGWPLKRLYGTQDQWIIETPLTHYHIRADGEDRATVTAYPRPPLGRSMDYKTAQPTARWEISTGEMEEMAK